MTDTIELGLDTFGDVTADATGQPLSHAQVLRNVVAQAVLADQVGLQMASIELYGTQVAPRVRELLDAAGYRAGALASRS